jgi:hypothetical protein
VAQPQIHMLDTIGIAIGVLDVEPIVVARALTESSWRQRHIDSDRRRLVRTARPGALLAAVARDKIPATSS